MWDTHCHLFKEYYEDIYEVINKAKENGINKMITAGCDAKTNKEVLEIIKERGVYGAIGIHPESVLDYKKEDLDFIKENLNNKKIIAMGEIGLDYHYSKENREEQIKLFESQLEIAEDYHLPVVVHMREATNDTIECLKKYKVKGVIHAFSGSLETAKIFLKMGFKLGINGVITFKNCNLKEVIEQLDLSSIVLETDAPYLTPVPFRGQRNEPSHIKEIAEFICDIKKISLEELVKITNQNVLQIFDIKGDF